MTKPYPVIVSFYAGDDYYYQAAAALKKDCQRLGLDHDIVEAPLKKPVNWIEACRYKIQFIDQCLKKHKRPILWVDVDCRLLAKPEILKDSQVDMAFFLRAFRYFRDFDPGSWARVMTPGVIYYGNTDPARAFIELLKKLEKKHRGSATDDYFLQEAWTQFDKPLAITLLPPDIVSTKVHTRKNAAIQIGHSGAVPANITQAQQHQANPITPVRRKSALLFEASRLTAAGRHNEALCMQQLAFEADPKDEPLAQHLARQLRERGDTKSAQSTMAKLEQAQGSLIRYERRFMADSEMLSGNLNRAEEILRELVKRSGPLDEAWARSRLIRLGLEQRAAKLKLRTSQRPPLWWMEAPYPGNFGDMLNPYLIEKLSGKPPLFSPRDRSIIAIGSTIKFASAGSYVWGAGTPRTTDNLNPKAHYAAVRGPLTRDLVLRSGGKCPDVYGDPAWFLPQIYTPKSGAKKYKLGLIRHYVHEDDLGANDKVKIITVMRAGYEGIEKFIDEINQCECILTTSLHGLIVSHAYGIPARWCEVVDASSAIAGDGTKYHDYMMSVGLKPEPPLKLHKNTIINLTYVKEAQRLPKRQIDLEALANAAPFEIKTRWRQRAPKGREGQMIQTGEAYKNIHLTAQPGHTSAWKRRVKQIDSRLLNDSLRKIYARLRN